MQNNFFYGSIFEKVGELPHQFSKNLQETIFLKITLTMTILEVIFEAQFQGRFFFILIDS